MGTKAYIIGLAAAFLSGCSTAPSPLPFGALPDSGVVTAAPRGFADFCRRFPRQCRAQPHTPNTVPMTESNWHRLTLVNEAVNKAIKPETDSAHYGVPEYWTIPSDGFGDCEDFALTKRRDLMRAGLPASVLRLAVVDTMKHGLHAILTVSTDDGDFVLDNVTNQILLWSATGYIWVSAQSHTDPMRWNALRPAPDNGLATAAHPTVNKTGNHIAVP